MWLLLITAILAVLVILLLMIPLTLQLHLQRDDTLSWQVSASWFFGFIRTEFKKKRLDEPVQEKQVVGQGEQTSKDQPARKNILRPILSMWGTREFPNTLARLLVKV